MKYRLSQNLNHHTSNVWFLVHSFSWWKILVASGTFRDVYLDSLVFKMEIHRRLCIWSNGYDTKWFSCCMKINYIKPFSNSLQFCDKPTKFLQSESFDFLRMIRWISVVTGFGSCLTGKHVWRNNNELLEDANRWNVNGKTQRCNSDRDQLNSHCYYYIQQILQGINIINWSG